MAITHQPSFRGIRAIPRESQQAAAGSRWIVPIFFVVVALPAEFALKIFDATLSPARLFALFVILPAFAKLLSDRTVRLMAFDYVLFCYLLWLWLAILVNHPLGKGIYLGGSLTAEALGAYAIARAYVRTYEDFARAVGVYFTTILVVAVFAIVESFARLAIIHEIAFRLIGEEVPLWITSNYDAMYDRLGLFRPFSTFDHCILYGTFCAGATALIYFLSRDQARKWLRLSAVVVAVFFSLSSGPYMGCLMALGLCLWEKVTRPIPNRVLLTIGGLLAVLLVIMIGSNRGLIEILIASTLDPKSGYYRLFIWEYGSAAVAQNPLFGISLDKWTRAHFMSTSIDNFWLVMAMLGGLPAIGALLLFVLSILLRVNRRSTLPELRWRASARLGWTFTVLILCVEGLTVHYWGQLYAYFFFMIGLGAWMADTQRGFAAAAEPRQHIRQEPSGWVGRRVSPASRPLPSAMQTAKTHCIGTGCTAALQRYRARPIGLSSGKLRRTLLPRRSMVTPPTRLVPLLRLTLNTGLFHVKQLRVPMAMH